MSRLPIPGQDKGTWGTVLNDFLSQSHDMTGGLKPGIISSDKLAPDVRATLDATISQDELTTAIESKANVTNVYAKSDADAKFAAIDQIGLKVVYHAANAGFARPTTPASVLWVGSVNPSNIIANDLYFHSTALPPPATYLFDDYNRADGAPGATPTGAFTIASTSGSVVAISNNKIGFSTLTTTSYAYYITGHRVARHKWVMGAAQTDASQTILFRFSSTTNHFLLARVSSTTKNYRLLKRIGSATPVEIATTSVPMASGDVIEILDATDGTVTIWINTVQVYTGVQSELLSNSGIGFGATVTGANFATTIDSLESKEAS